MLNYALPYFASKSGLVKQNNEKGGRVLLLGKIFTHKSEKSGMIDLSIFRKRQTTFAAEEVLWLAPRFRTAAPRPKRGSLNTMTENKRMPFIGELKQATEK